MRTFLQSVVASALVCVSAAVFAGGPTHAEPPPPEPALDEGVYVDLSVGYALVDWARFGIGAFDGYSAVTGTGLVGSVTSNGRGSFTFGGDVGYQVNKYFGIEGGWYRLPTVSGNSDVFFNLPDLKLGSWFAYLALKLIAPLSRHFDLFIKAGAGFRQLNYSGSASSISGFGPNSTDYISGVVGGGLQYWFDDNWSVSIQDLYMFRNNSGSTISRRAPGANLLLASVGYRFGVVS